MKYQALYRAYRPKQFKDVAGQVHIVRTIKNAIKTNKISHAYLFSGPRGTGKTTTAKLLAKAINCLAYDGNDACGECENCNSILNGQSQDIIEIDAASNNGVDEIRDLRDKVKYAPSNCKYKVYIIDEVHMLTPGAFNALLKTLEEPPSHVIFVLATTEPHKIPLTIISRCQRFDFKKISREAIVSRLSEIVEQENIKVQKNVLNLIAKISDGGMRDAIGILDQAVAFSEGSVKLSDVYELTGVVSIEMLEKIVGSTIKNNKVECLKLINEFHELGKDVVRLTEDIILYFRDMLLYKHLPSLEEVKGNLYVSDKLGKYSKVIDDETIYESIEKLSKILNEMRFSSNPKILLEITMLNLIVIDNKQVVDKMVDEIVDVVVDEIHQEEIIDSQKEVKSTLNVEMEPEVIDDEKIEEINEPDNNDNEDELVPVDDEKNQELIRMAEELKQEIKKVRINNILALAQKSELVYFRSRWESIKSYSMDPVYGATANLIASSTVEAASPEGLVITFKHEPMAIRVMDSIELIENLIEKMFLRKMFIVSITEREWISIKDEYIHKVRRGHKYRVLPEPNMETIKKINREIKNNKVKEEPIVQKALDLDFLDDGLITIED